MRLDRRRFLELAAGALVGLRSGGASAGEPRSLALEVHRATCSTRRGAIGRRLWPFGARLGTAKPYAGWPRIELPPPGASGGPALDAVVRNFAPAPALGPAPIPLDALARLLHLTNGVTEPGDHPLRAAPSAGALYSGEVYVVVDEVPGLEAGVYSHHVPSHRLVQLATGRRLASVAAAVERPAALGDATACVVLTNVFARYGQRYANRGYRYALIDSGHIGENLRLAAASQGLDVASPSRFHDDALNALLEIDGREEAVCAVHVIGRGRAGGAEPSDSRGLVEAQHARSFSPGEARSAPERYHAATKLVPGEGPPPPSAAPAARTAPALPAREPPGTTLAWTIQERRSARRFLERPIALADLAYVLDLARGSAAAGLAGGIELRLVVHRVTGLAPGLHAYDPARHALKELRRQDLVEALRRACGGQAKASSAAVGFAMVADLAGAAFRGDRSYRDLLVEAGQIGQRLYLAAESIGLAARNLAAFFDADLNELLGVDGERRAVVHLTMLGPGD